MTPSWDRVRAILESAVEHRTATRRDFVEGACAGDQDLRREVLSLLSGLERDPSFLEPPVERLLPQHIGPYRVIRPIGEGGMGVVYEGVRDDGEFEQRVAIKTIRTPLTDDLLTRRFLLERRVLARFEHPNVARLLDAGTTVDGRPWLAMEFVDGIPIDEFCRERRLRVRDILELMRSICSAVSCAHRCLIVHRDIKPSNVLVTADGVPKLLDFGIAKLIDQCENGLTATGQHPMTPAYASPEQVNGKVVTAGSDVFSLGVLLYQLVTTKLPWRTASGARMDVQIAIVHQEPDRPSAAAGIAPHLRRELRGDIDAIILRALEKDPQRRYPSVDRLDADLRRYLNDLPVTAMAGTTRYLARKFVKRHATALGLATVTLLALLTAGAISGLSLSRAERQRAEAVSRFEDVRRVARFILFDLDAALRAGSGPTRKAVIAMGLDYLGRLERVKGDASLQAEIAAGYCRIGDIQCDLSWDGQGDVAGARRSYQRASSIGQQLAFVPGLAQRAGLILALAAERSGELLLAEGDSEGASREFERARERLRRLGDFDEAKRLLAQVDAVSKKRH